MSCNSPLILAWKYPKPVNLRRILFLECPNRYRSTQVNIYRSIPIEDRTYLLIYLNQATDVRWHSESGLPDLTGPVSIEYGSYGY